MLLQCNLRKLHSLKVSEYLGMPGTARLSALRGPAYGYSSSVIWRTSKFEFNPRADLEFISIRKAALLEHIGSIFMLCTRKTSGSPGLGPAVHVSRAMVDVIREHAQPAQRDGTNCFGCQEGEAFFNFRTVHHSKLVIGTLAGMWHLCLKL